MSIDFWAGYVSGVAGIIVGNPLDILKLHKQIQSPTAKVPRYHGISSPLLGTAAPVLGLGVLNAILFVSYNRTNSVLCEKFPSPVDKLWTAWLAGAVGGLATWAIGAPTELIKCRVQGTGSGNQRVSSLTMIRNIWQQEGVRGFYVGGVITALRDSIGYGFYFWSYELTTRHWPGAEIESTSSPNLNATRSLLCGGVAGVVTWASIFPLDVIKSRVQTKHSLGLRAPTARINSIQCAQEAFQEGGMKVFFRGLTICSIRAFVVNAVQWALYEWIMLNYASN